MKLLKDNYNKTDLKNTILIVTGATSGIGLSLAKELYSLNATVIFASRNKSKAEKIINEIKAEYPNSTGVFDIGVLDTEDLASIKEFANWYKKKYDRVDYLINNAGIQYGSIPGNPLFNLDTPILSKQGYDQMFVTNYMGHFLLTELLLPIITDKVINVSSGFHFFSEGETLMPTEHKASGKVMPDAAIGENRGPKHRRAAYAVTKLAQVLHTKELQRRIDKSDLPNKNTIKAVTICPGWVQTNILGADPVARFISFHSFPSRAGLLDIMSALFDKSLEGGSYVTNYLLPFRRYSWFDSMLTTTSKLGIRKMVTLLLGMLMLMMESWSYGYHKKDPSSLESRDPILAAKLYDWTRSELVEKGYLDK